MAGAFRASALVRWTSQWQTRPLGTSSLCKFPNYPSGIEPSKPESSTDRPPAATIPYKKIPKTKCFLGINWELIRNPYSLVEYLEKQVKVYGKIFRDQAVPFVPAYLYIFDPKDVEVVFRMGDKGHPKRYPMKIWKDVCDELKLPHGLFLKEGEGWLEHRIPISQCIMLPTKVADYYLAFNEISQGMLNHIRRRRDANFSLTDITNDFSRWSYESISLVVFGKRLGCLEEPPSENCIRFIDNVCGFVDMTNKLMMAPRVHKYRKTKSFMKLVDHYNTIYTIANDMVQSKISEIRTSRPGGSRDVEDRGFLSYLFQSGKMSVEEITVNAIGLVIAGVNSTNLAMAACLYCLAKSPEAQDKLRREIQTVVRQEAVVTPTHIHNMPYLRDCVKEAQRLYPVSPNNVRILNEGVVLSGYQVPAGVPIVMGTAVSGRLPEYYSEPNKFSPERWSRKSKELPNPFLSLPFGFGKRMCVGQRIAELQMYILLAQLVKNFEIGYPEDKPLKYIVKMVYCPEKPMNLVFKDL